MTRFVLTAFLFIACAGADEPSGDDTGIDASDTNDTDDTDDTSDTDDVDTGVAGTTVGFATDIEPITSSACSSCHTSAASGGFANADTHAGWQATSSVGLAYCEPGSPDDSYGFRKIVGDHADVGGSGTKMPQGGSLSAAEVDLFEAWVLDGCLP